MKPELKIELVGEETPATDMGGKVIIVGDTGVGKTCIMLRASKNEFKEEHSVTLGADFTNYFLKVEGKTVKLQLWDTCGLEMYTSMIRVFFKGADAALLVFDVTRDKSFEAAEKWLHELRENSSADLLCYLVGNKIDLPNRVVAETRAQEFVRINHLRGYYETSAKSGKGIVPVVETMVADIYTKKLTEQAKEDSFALHKKQDGSQGKGCKC